MRKHKRLVQALALLVVAYSGSYLLLSRRGYAEADRDNIHGFYYFAPVQSDTWRVTNYGCVYLFSPANWVDRSVGFGRPPAREPLWGLSR